MTEDNSCEGTIPFKVPSTGDEAHTYYKIYGDINSGPPPIIVLHGGPASGHEYCLPFAKLQSLFGIPTIFYDQIGCAQSTHFREKVHDEAFWDRDLFLAELENLIKHCGLDRTDGTGYDILGHSWGGILATCFASRQPRGLRRLIIAGSPANGENFSAGLWTKLERMSVDAKRTVEQAVEKDDFTGPEYLAVVNEFNRTFLCRARPFPPPLFAVNEKHQKDAPTVVRTILGRSLWTFEGSIRRWDQAPFSHKIAVPSLIINGEWDTADESDTIPFYERMPNVRWATVAGASHMYFLDSEDLEAKTMNLVGEFLRAAEGEWRQGKRWTV